MGYRNYNNYNYRGLRRKRQASRPRRYTPGAGEEFRALLVLLFAPLGRWLVRTLGKLRPKPRNPPLPFSVLSIPVGRRSAPVLQLQQRHTPVRPSIEALPYRKVSALLTRGERGVWYPLYRAVKGRYRLFCKVRLADVVCCPHDHPEEGRWFRKIGRYHVDFVICDPTTTAPLLVVELDDHRHRQPKRQARDEFKDAVLHSAGVPIYRIPAQPAYDLEELTSQIERLIHPAE